MIAVLLISDSHKRVSQIPIIKGVLVANFFGNFEIKCFALLFLYVTRFPCGDYISPTVTGNSILKSFLKYE